MTTEDESGDHEAQMIRVTICAVCERDVYWDDDRAEWLHYADPVSS